MKVILHENIRVGKHLYRLYYAVADCRYDFMLGMPWQKEATPVVDYSNSSVSVGGELLLLQLFAAKVRRLIQFTNLRVKRFQRLLKKKHNRDDFALFELIEKDRPVTAPIQPTEEKKVDDRLKKLF